MQRKCKGTELRQVTKKIQRITERPCYKILSTGLGKKTQRIWVQCSIQVWDTIKTKEICKLPSMVSIKGTCYKQNMSVATDPTYLTVNLITTSLVTWHKEETTPTSDGPSSEVVKKGKRER
jgi:hypothetical protein